MNDCIWLKLIKCREEECKDCMEYSNDIEVLEETLKHIKKAKADFNKKESKKEGD